MLTTALKPLSGAKRKLSVLVIDDYAEMRMLIRGMLRTIGSFNVADDDGRRALALLREGRFDLLISDIYMGTVNGLALLREIRADAKLASLPVILATAGATSTAVTAAKQLGVSGLLVKPFTTATLARQVGEALAQKQREPAAAANPVTAEAWNDAVETLIAELERRTSARDAPLRREMIAQLHALLDRAVEVGLDPVYREKAIALCAKASAEIDAQREAIVLADAPARPAPFLCGTRA